MYHLLGCLCPQAINSHTAVQHAIETSVAATMGAVITATEATPSDTPTAGTIPPTIPPTFTALPTGTATATIQPSPTPETTASIALNVAYIIGGNVWLWAGGKDNIQLTDTGDAVDLAISDDGELIAFKRQDPDNLNIEVLWVTDTSGGPEERVLVSSMELAEAMPADPGAYITGIGVLDFDWRPGHARAGLQHLDCMKAPGLAPIMMCAW